MIHRTSVRTAVLTRARLRASEGLDSTAHGRSRDASPIVAAHLRRRPSLKPQELLWVVWQGENGVGCVTSMASTQTLPGADACAARCRAVRGNSARRAPNTQALPLPPRGGIVRSARSQHRRLAQRLYGLDFRPIAPYRPVEFGDTLFYEPPTVAIRYRRRKVSSLARLV